MKIFCLCYHRYGNKELIYQVMCKGNQKRIIYAFTFIFVTPSLIYTFYINIHFISYNYICKVELLFDKYNSNITKSFQRLDFDTAYVCCKRQSRYSRFFIICFNTHLLNSQLIVNERKCTKKYNVSQNFMCGTDGGGNE